MGPGVPRSAAGLSQAPRPGPARLGACRAHSSLWGGETQRVGALGVGTQSQSLASQIVLKGHREGCCGTLGLWPTAWLWTAAWWPGPPGSPAVSSCSLESCPSAGGRGLGQAWGQ